MWSRDQSLVILTFLWEKSLLPQFYKDLTKKTAFFEGWCWFKFNNLGQALVTNLKFCTSVAKGLKLKARNFWGTNSYLCRSYRGKTGRGIFLPPPPSWIGLTFKMSLICTVLLWIRFLHILFLLLMSANYFKIQNR